VITTLTPGAFYWNHFRLRWAREIESAQGFHMYIFLCRKQVAHSFASKRFIFSIHIRISGHLSKYHADRNIQIIICNVLKRTTPALKHSYKRLAKLELPFIGLIPGNDSDQYATGVFEHIMYCVPNNPWTATKKQKKNAWPNLYKKC
jgi:hypothetical protein